MSKLKDLVFFIFGLILVIGGLLSFVFIPISTQQNININVNHLIALGFILLFLGAIMMYLFIKTEDKKEKSNK